MLKRFRVSNFRSLVNVEFFPTGLNLLIGPNNAGKTNLCSALRFIGLSSRGSLEEIVKATLGETWNITNVYLKDTPFMEFEIEAVLRNGEEILEYDYLLRVAVDRDPINSRQTFKIEDEILRVTGAGFQQTPLIENHHGHAKVLNESRTPSSGGPHTYDNLVSSGNNTIISSLYDTTETSRAILLKHWLQTWAYYNFNLSALRSPEVIIEKAVLRQDGANLGKTLHILHNEKPREEKRLIEELRTIEPKLDLFTFQSPDPSVVYLILEDKDGNRFSTRSISDGTLRFLAMAYLILANGAVTDPLLPPPLYIIEEPENGLYVRVLKPLIEKIDPTGSAGQFIFTTHSPYLIDLFDSHLEGVHLFRPGKPSSILSRPDPDKIKTLLAEMPLGELHFREMLG